jgi:hypothetical protein
MVQAHHQQGNQHTPSISLHGWLQPACNRNPLLLLLLLLSPALQSTAAAMPRLMCCCHLPSRLVSESLAE